MEKLNKLSLPVVIIIASIILGGFFYASQVNKQRSIERQQQIELTAKGRLDCLAIYKVENDKWSNVRNWRYSDFNNVCEIIYRSYKTGKNFSRFY